MAANKYKVAWYLNEIHAKHRNVPCSNINVCSEKEKKIHIQVNLGKFEFSSWDYASCCNVKCSENVSQ